MAVWSDKIDLVDEIVAAHVNQLADGFSTANTYNFGGTTTLEQLAASHAAAGAHTGKIQTGDIVDNTIAPADLQTKCLASRQATVPSALGKGRLHIDTTGNQTNCDSEGSWQAIIIGTANIYSGVAGTGLEVSAGALRIGTAAAGTGLTGGGGAALAVNVGVGLEINTDAVRIGTAAAGTGLTGGGGVALSVGAGSIGPTQLGTAVAGDGLSGGGGAALAVKVDNATIEVSGDIMRVKDGGIGPTQLGTAVAGNGLTGGGGAALAVLVAGGDDGLEFTGGSIQATHADLSNYGVVKFVTSTGTAAGLAIQANDQRLHRRILFGDTNQSYAGTAAPLGTFVHTDPGGTVSVDKFFFTYNHGADAGANAVLFVAQTQVDSDPGTRVATIQVYLTDGAIDTASKVGTITSFGSFAKLEIAVDASTLNQGPHSGVVRMAWAGTAPSGTCIAAIKWPLVYTISQ